jgi:hypothetical protein
MTRSDVTDMQDRTMVDSMKRAIIVFTGAVLIMTVLVVMTDHSLFQRLVVMYFWGLQDSGATPDPSVNYTIGSSLDRLERQQPISEQIRGADYVMKVRIHEVDHSRFNTTDGKRPANDNGGLWEIIATPLIVDVVEYYKASEGSPRPTGWALMMLGGSLERVTNNNSGYTGESIKKIGATGVVFISAMEVNSGELATPENVEPIFRIMIDKINMIKSYTGRELGLGIIFNWYLLEHGRAISYRDIRNLSESGLIQEIHEGLQGIEERTAETDVPRE